MAPLLLASEVAWGDDAHADNNDEFRGQWDGLSPAAKQPLSRMSEEEQRVKDNVVLAKTSALRGRLATVVGATAVVLWSAEVLFCRCVLEEVPAGCGR